MTTYENALKIVADEVEQRLSLDMDATSYARGLLAGYISGLKMPPSTFLAIHGAEQRLRHITREVLLQDGLMQAEPIKGL